MAVSLSNAVSCDVVVKGSLIPETYAAFRNWDLSLPQKDNLASLKRDNPIGAKSAQWLAHIVKGLQHRFDTGGRDRALVELAQAGLDVELWKPMLLWHMTRNEFLFRDFLSKWLFAKFRESVRQLRSSDVMPYLASLAGGKKHGASEWTDHTRKRIACGLLRMSADFGLRKGKVTRTFAVYHLPEQSFLYLLHAMMDDFHSATKVIDSPDWRMFLMTRHDVEAELLRLHQFRKLHFETAGSLADLRLPCGSAAEFARRLVA